ncbi:MAG: phycobiliprotein lyase [Cyanobacteria bacterium P01_D01_bin.73]
MDAMEFFRRSVGLWRSQRTTHHLPFRRSEIGESNITVGILEAGDPKVIEICNMHNIDPALASGGADVTWKSLMAWDSDSDNHDGASVMVIVPDSDNPYTGKLLRERGYAESDPVAGHYQMDAENGLVLITEYETMSSVERFWFTGDNMRMRTSTLKRFGGFNTATFCTEVRVDVPDEKTVKAQTVAPKTALSTLGW